ncbi:MAG: iron-sulfur cluster assembly scaffold protein [Elusimicrobiota bacterium]
MNIEDIIKKYRGRLNDYDASSSIKGHCGDTMEFYIRVEDGKISAVKYEADGCAVTHACGAVVAFYVDGKPIKDAFYISPGLVVNTLGGVPEDHLHCPVLAVMAFFSAVGEYLSKP